MAVRLVDPSAVAELLLEGDPGVRRASPDSALLGLRPQLFSGHSPRCPGVDRLFGRVDLERRCRACREFLLSLWRADEIFWRHQWRPRD